MNYWEVYKAVWEFHKKYQSISTDEEWKQAIYESNQIAKKLNSKFVNDLLLAVINELERKYHAEKQRV